MCQALGISFEDKYKVSSTDIIELLKNNSGKNLIKNVYGFCKALFLANIVGSVDGHAKNYSILLDDDVILAPIYDVFSCYGKEYKTEEVYKTAMKIGDNDIIGTLSKKDVIKFAKKNKLDVELLLDGLKEICEKLPNVVEKVFSDNSSIKELMEFKDIFIYNVKKNAKKILTDL
jgi:serine/threonine-protein kinase HipA